MAWAAAPAVRADDPPPTPAKTKQGPYVVLVGVGEYGDKAISSRPTADADAKALYDLFADPKYAIAAKDRVVLLTSEPDAARGSQKATRENVLAALRTAVTKTGPDDTIILGMFGRMASAGDATAIFTTDSTFKDRNKNSVLGTDLAAILKPAKDHKLCFLFDLSSKGINPGKETAAEPGLRDVLTALFGVEEKEDQLTIHDKVLFLSSVPTFDPLTKGDHGLFASVVIDALKGAADKEGYEPDGNVTVDELYKYVDKTATDEARKIGKTAAQKESDPYIVGEETSHFIVSHNPAAYPQTVARLAKLDALIKDGKLDKDIAAEAKQYLSRMPKLKALQELRKKYEALVDGTLSLDDFKTARLTIKNGMKMSVEDAETYMRKVRSAERLLKEDYVKVVNEGELAVAAAKGMYRLIEEPFPAEFAEMDKKAKTLTSDEQRDLLTQARLRLGRREDLDGDKAADLSIRMMIASLDDPHTVYYDKETLKKVEAPLRGQFSGIGIQIRRDLVKDGLLVVTPIKGSPAYKAGVKAGDVITEIRREVGPQGEPLTSEQPKVISTKGMKTEKALDIILGKPGTPVSIVVERETAGGKTEQKQFDLKRGRVTVETVLGVSRKADDTWNYWLDEPNKVAYLCLTQFTQSTITDLKYALDKLKASGMKALVLDLRFNPGGTLVGGVIVCDFFLEEGLILEVRPRVGETEKYYDRGIGSYVGFPMTVLVNGFSASASEIVSACLQDYHRAVIVGERTYGKGTVQQVKPFNPTGGEIKLTIARFFPPLGRNIDRLSTPGKPEDEWGVKPDKGHEVKLSKDEQKDLIEAFRDREIIPRRDLPTKETKPAFKDRQLEAALDYLKTQLKPATAKK
jgi:C-terminal peptidase prc